MIWYNTTQYDTIQLETVWNPLWLVLWLYSNYEIIKDDAFSDIGNCQKVIQTLNILHFRKDYVMSKITFLEAVRSLWLILHATCWEHARKGCSFDLHCMKGVQLIWRILWCLKCDVWSFQYGDHTSLMMKCDQNIWRIFVYAWQNRAMAFHW